jgi:O-methyltransferase involved in polyketide biosynthesis
MTGEKIKVELDGVPETQLWTLYHRASEARRPGGVLDDPRAVALVDSIDYPFAERFGTGGHGFGQMQALRVRAFDIEVKRFLAAHPDGTVVALGEGLETQFWRVDNGRVRWLTVDLPESAEVRRTLLPADDDRRRVIAQSALDTGWTAEVDTANGVLVTAQGLLMYLHPDEVRTLIAACAAAFPGGGMVFDAIPRWLSTATKRGFRDPATGYQIPTWHWAMDPRDRPKLREAHPGIRVVRDVPLPSGRGPLGLAAPWLGRLPLAGAVMPSITYLGFAART